MNDRIERPRLEDDLRKLLITDTQVPFGETEIQPGDPRIVGVVNDVVLPVLEALDPDEIRQHPMGDVAVRFGPQSDDGFLIQTYVVSQHANLMDDANAGSIVDGRDYGYDGPVAVGQGATQGKGPMAAAIAAVRARASSMARPVWLTVNTEGRSSHGGSIRLLDDLGVAAAQGVVSIGTDLKISLGNRGRVDVLLKIKGRSSHSSQPWLGANPIPEGAKAIAALEDLSVPPEHSSLGPVTVTPYQFSCSPLAPHTIPEEVSIVVDRRLLPGEQPADAVATIAAHLKSSGVRDVDVVEGVSMLPAEVSDRSSIVRSLVKGLAESGVDPETIWSLNCFDAGYACSKGIPTPMFGPGKRRFSGEGLVGVDAVSVDDCLTAASVLAHSIDSLCGA
ncbi:MAG: peptidase dimerization domain-containing protein [Actinomycetota bacterium]|nr:peptidase dimerization domain-containing protein [Actinomycetota bacterium]